MEENYTALVHRAFTEPILLGGVPREAAILNGTLSAAIVVGFHVLWWVIPAGIIHVAMILIARKDPQFMDVIKRAVNKKRLYDV